MFLLAATAGQCGIGRLYTFMPEESVKNYNSSVGYTAYNESTKLHNQVKTLRCTGFFGSGFLNDDICKAVYEELAAKYKLVFQTPVRQNANSGNKFFYAMFDRNPENKDVDYIEPKWPY
jgi:hypothetical protein